MRIVFFDLSIILLKILTDDFGEAVHVEVVQVAEEVVEATRHDHVVHEQRVFELLVEHEEITDLWNLQLMVHYIELDVRSVSELPHHGI